MNYKTIEKINYNESNKLPDSLRTLLNEPFPVHEYYKLPKRFFTVKNV